MIDQEKIAERIAKIVIGRSKPPKPSSVGDGEWEEWLGEYWESLEKSFERSGIKIKSFNPSDWFYDYFELEYSGIQFTMGLGEASPRGLKGGSSFVRNIDDAVDLAEDIEVKYAGSDIFYDDIHRRVHRVFKTKEGRHLAFSFVTDYLRKNGIRVHS